MRTNERWNINAHDVAGYGKTLLELIEWYKEDVLTYGVVKEWQEGKYTIKKHHSASTVLRYISIYRDSIVMIRRTENNRKSIISVITDALTELTSSITDYLNMGIFIDDSLYSKNEITTRNHLCNKETQNNIKKLYKVQPYKRLNMKIPL